MDGYLLILGTERSTLGAIVVWVTHAHIVTKMSVAVVMKLTGTNWMLNNTCTQCLNRAFHCARQADINIIQKINPISHKFFSTVSRAQSNSNQDEIDNSPQARYNKWLYRSILDKSKFILFCQYNNMKTSQLNTLRFELKQKGIETKFIISRQLRELIPPECENNPLHVFCSGPAVIFYTEHEPEVMAELMQKLRKSKHLLMTGGIFEKKIFSFEVLMEIAEKIQCRKNMQSQLIGLLRVNSMQLFNCLNASKTSICKLLSVHAENRASVE